MFNSSKLSITSENNLKINFNLIFIEPKLIEKLLTRRMNISDSSCVYNETQDDQI